MDEVDGLNARIPPDLVCSLLPRDTSSVTALTVRNTDLGPLALRGRSLQAKSLERSGVFMGEQTHVVTRASGRLASGRRALGVVSGRIREGEGATASLSEFAEWCDRIATEVAGAAPPSDLFGRFATPVSPPIDTTPRSILVDLDAYEGQFIDEDLDEVDFDLESACADIIERPGGPAGFGHCFELGINQKTTLVWIRWDRKKSKYWLKSSELSKLFDRNSEQVSLTSRINRQQPFRIIINDSLIYAYGKFYSVDLQLGKPGGPGALVLELLCGLPALRRVTSEKGQLAGRSDKWPDDSLFGLIDGSLRNDGDAQLFGRPFEALVCDDLGQEVADFIGADPAPPARVAFVAAKWKGGVPGAGAGSAYDVCAQALKNLAYLKADAQSLPGHPRKWDRDWSLAGGRVPRRRAGPGSLAFRSLFQQVRANPAANREMWLVLGGGILSKQAVENEFGANSPRAHVLQLFHLLLSVYAGCQSLGVDLKVYCAD